MFIPSHHMLWKPIFHAKLTVLYLIYITCFPKKKKKKTLEMKIKLLMQIDANMKQKSNRNRNEKRI